MKQKLQGIIIGLLIGTMLTGGLVFAEDISKNVTVFYNNIKIFVDGGEIVPKDTNGKVIKPFTMDGTIYLPISTIANAFGKDVVWDSATSSIFFGKKGQNEPDNYLDRIPYNAYISDFDDDNIYKINGTITDFNNVDYKSGILLYRGYSGGFSVKIDYPLNMQYTKLTGKVVLPKKIDISGLSKDNALDSDAQVEKIEIYGDGKLIKTIPKVSISNPYPFEIDVKGVGMLSIKVIKDKDWHSYYCALTDLSLYK